MDHSLKYIQVIDLPLSHFNLASYAQNVPPQWRVSNAQLQADESLLVAP